MEITVKGGTASQKKRVPQMIEYCVNKMMPRMQNLEINVVLKDLGKSDAYGFCLAVDGPRSDRPREFELEIHNKMSMRKVLETVAHEMVHVKQYARGELYESSRTAKHRWQGKYLKAEPDYWDQPWEIEAHGRETGLFVRWAEEMKLGKQKWTHDK
jgi:hypothetical protein